MAGVFKFELIFSSTEHVVQSVPDDRTLDTITRTLRAFIHVIRADAIIVTVELILIRETLPRVIDGENDAVFVQDGDMA